MVQATEHCHIVADGQIPSGGPVIKGTHTPARAIGELWWLGVLAGDQAAGPVSSTQVFDTLVTRNHAGKMPALPAVSSTQVFDTLVTRNHAGKMPALPAVSSTQVFDTLVAAAIEPRSTPTWSATGFRIC
jgi:uncharacterized protein (DUF433 family)